MTAKTTLTIGELATRTGVTPDTLRYYERLGLIARVPRTQSGFRAYPVDVVVRVQFVRQAQRHGLTLAEIGELVRLDTRRGADQCRQVQRLLRRKVVELDERLTEIQDFRRTLDTYLARCDRTLAEKSDAACPVVEDLRRSAS